MKYENYNIEQLIIDSLAGTISPEDEIILEKAIAEDPQAAKIWKDYSNALALYKAGHHEWNKDKVWKAIQQVIAQDSKAKTPDTDATIHRHGKLLSMKNHFSWKRYVAAASILLFIGVISYFISIRSTTEKQIAKTSVQNQNDVLPGGNKAVLTLADGRALVLDSSKNGALAIQGNTQVIKGDGTLAYNEQQQVGIVLQPVYNSVSTPKGGQYQLTLADGSKVWLNAASSIRFPTAFTGNERRVDITGEAYFEVVHDASKPFHVSVNGVDVQVLGTHFDINAYSDEESVRTTLLEGSVKVSVGNKDVTIKPRQQAAIVSGNASTMNVINNVNTDEIIAWKDGFFHFESADIKTILRQFARWYDVEIVYEGPVSNRKFFGIVKRNNTLKKVLEMLQDNNIVYKIEGKKLIVKSG